MTQPPDDGNDPAVLQTIAPTLMRLTDLGQDLVRLATRQNELVEHAGQTEESLLGITSSAAGHTERQTSMAQERIELGHDVVAGASLHSRMIGYGYDRASS